MLQFALALAITSPIYVSAFEPWLPQNGRARTVFRNEKTELRADGNVNGNSVAAGPDQSEYGKSLELPNTYASCGQCGAAFALTLEAMGPGKGGRYVIHVTTRKQILPSKRISSTGKKHNDRSGRYRSGCASKCSEKS